MKVHIFVSGRVQSVGYRYTALWNAMRLGVSGFAKNLDDGRVEVWAVGDDPAVKRFIELCKKGSMFTKVSGFDMREEEPAEEFRNFRIRY